MATQAMDRNAVINGLESMRTLANIPVISATGTVARSAGHGNAAKPTTPAASVAGPSILVKLIARLAILAAASDDWLPGSPTPSIDRIHSNRVIAQQTWTNYW